MKKDKEESKKNEEQSEDVKQLQPQKEAEPRFVGTIVKLNDRTEEVVQYPKGSFTVEYLTQYVQATALKTGVITRLPYTSIHFIKEVTR